MIALGLLGVGCGTGGETSPPPSAHSSHTPQHKTVQPPPQDQDATYTQFFVTTSHQFSVDLGGISSYSKTASQNPTLIYNASWRQGIMSYWDDVQKTADEVINYSNVPADMQTAHQDYVQSAQYLLKARSSFIEGINNPNSNGIDQSATYMGLSGQMMINVKNDMSN
jgi:hypothetical protein